MPKRNMDNLTLAEIFGHVDMPDAVWFSSSSSSISLAAGGVKISLAMGLKAEVRETYEPFVIARFGFYNIERVFWNVHRNAWDLFSFFSSKLFVVSPAIPAAGLIRLVWQRKDLERVRWRGCGGERRQ